MRRRRLGSLVLAVVAGLPACRDESKPAMLATTSSSGTSGGTTETGEGPPPGEAADFCGAAPVVGAGRHYGTLRGKTSDRSGACGHGGPDAFFVLDVPRRVDVRLQASGIAYQPTIGVLPSACGGDWAVSTLLCTHGIEGWVLDVPAGAELVASIGVASDHPVLGLPVPEGAADPLDFRLDVEFRDVLLQGEPCGAVGRGRCVTGTACRPVQQDTGTTGSIEIERCVALDGDTCSTAEPLALDFGLSVLMIDRDTPQTDAHSHACAGARRPERVLRLSLPSMLSAQDRLEVRTDAGDIALALRGPGCLVDEALSCAPAPAPVVAIEQLGVLGDARTVFVFVELPTPVDDAATTGSTTTGTSSGTDSTTGGEEAPVILEIELVDVP